MNPNDQEETALASLLAGAGPRTRPPGAVAEAVYRSSLLAWQQQLAQRRRRRWIMALAAGIACAAIGTGMILQRTGSRQQALSTAGNAALPADAQVERSGPEGQRLFGPTGESLRIKPDSRYAMQGERFWLLEGAVYVESDAVAEAGALVIEADGVAVRHVGTRYAVTLESGAVKIQVRDGIVEVDTGAARETAGGGMAVLATSGERQVERSSVAPWGAAWAWAEDLAPPLVIDGRILSQVLEEIARETGRRLVFDDENVQRSCEQTRLKGPVLDLPASGRLFAVLVATGLEAVENEERIVIRRKTD